MLNVTDDTPIVNWEAYGIDYSVPVPEINTDNNVVVPNSEVELTEYQLRHMEKMFGPP